MNGNGATPRKDWRDLPEWITTDEAAGISGYHPEYVRFLAREGRIGAEKKGRDWWINRDVLREYLATMEALGTKKHAGIPQETSQGEK